MEEKQDEEEEEEEVGGRGKGGAMCNVCIMYGVQAQVPYRAKQSR